MGYCITEDQSLSLPEIGLPIESTLDRKLETK